MFTLEHETFSVPTIKQWVIIGSDLQCFPFYNITVIR